MNYPGSKNKGASFAVTAKLICVFVYAYAKSRFSHNEAHISHSCLLGQCCIARLEVSFISMSGRSPTKLKVMVPRHNHSCLLGC